MTILRIAHICVFFLVIGLVQTQTLSQAWAQHQPGQGHGHGHGPGLSEKHVHHLHQDIPAYISAMESPDRATWQKPDELVRELGRLAALDQVTAPRIADLGAGPGYMTRRLAKAFPKGWIYSVDVEPKMLQALQERMKKEGLKNYTTVLAPTDDALLPPDALDLILILDVYHHLENRKAYLARLAGALRPKGVLVVVDFHKRQLPVGPPPSMKLSPEEVSAEAKAAGLYAKPSLKADFLPYQYVLVFGKSL